MEEKMKDNSFTRGDFLKQGGMTALSAAIAINFGTKKI